MTSAHGQFMSSGSLKHKIQPQPEHLDIALWYLLEEDSGRGFSLIAPSFSLSSSKALIHQQPWGGGGGHTLKRQSGCSSGPRKAADGALASGRALLGSDRSQARPGPACPAARACWYPLLGD